MSKRNYGYSYEIYAPHEGRRIDYEDHFATRTSATETMMEKMERDDVPVGSTAFVCRRYDDGDMTGQHYYIKRVVLIKKTSVFRLPQQPSE